MKTINAAVAAVTVAVLASAPPSSAAVLEEIIVTATKRSQSVQDVPVAVTALSGTELEYAGVTDIRGLQSLVPSFYLTSTSSETNGTTARLRGIGTQGNNPGLESAVGMYVDGVYRNRSTVGLTELGPVERIEVLRGPQGTLFGRNASAGVIQVITEQPSVDDDEGYFRVSGGDYSLLELEAGIGGALDPASLAGSFDVLYAERDGFFEEDALTGEDYNTHGRTLMRGQLVYRPTDTVSFRFIADASSRDESCCAGVYIVKGARTDPAIEALDPNTTLTSEESDPFGRRTYTTPGRNVDAKADEWGFSGELNWNLTEAATLTSITAWRDWDTENGGDLDYSGGDILYRDPPDLKTAFETFTQEFRLDGQTERLDWLLGFFYSNEELSTRLQTKVGGDYSAFTSRVLGVSADVAQGFPLGTVVLPPFSAFGAATASGDGSNDVWITDSESYALFTHNTWSVTERLGLTLGLRYTTEDKRLSGVVETTGSSCPGMLAATGFDANDPDGPITPILGGLTNGALALQCLGGVLNSTLDGSYADERSENELSGTLSLSYAFTDGVRGYLSYSNGYKAGGYNLDRSGLDPDTVLDGATSGPNAATNFGIATDVEALEFAEELVDAYEIGLKTTLADGRVNLNTAVYYQDFENFQLNTFNGLTFFVVTLNEVISQGVEVDMKAALSDSLYTNLGVSYNEATYADDLVRSDGVPADNLAGQQLTHAPELSVTGSLTYEAMLDGWSGWNGFATLDFRWTDEHNTGSDLDEEKMQDAYAVVNARVGLRSDDDRWSVELWAHNLFDEEYIQVAFDSPVQNTSGVQPLESYSAFLGDPRLWGLTVGYAF